jgi:hypothetical protein
MEICSTYLDRGKLLGRTYHIQERKLKTMAHELSEKA